MVVLYKETCPIEISDKNFNEFGGELYDLSELLNILMDMRSVEYLHKEMVFKLKHYIIECLNTNNYGLHRLNQMFMYDELVEMYELKFCGIILNKIEVIDYEY